MAIYIRKIPEYDVRRYEPNEPGFDLQAYIDWVTSHLVSGSAEPTGAFKNPDDTLTISVLYDGRYESEIIVPVGNYGVHLVSPASEWNDINFIDSDTFAANYQPKP